MGDAFVCIYYAFALLLGWESICLWQRKVWDLKSTYPGALGETQEEEDNTAGQGQTNLPATLAEPSELIDEGRDDSLHHGEL